MAQDELSGKLQELMKQRQLLDEELTKFKRLVTLMFVDIVGSTSYFDRYGDVSGLVYVHKCIDMLTLVAERHGGTICKTIGDALMTSFLDPVAAVQSAIDMQHTLDNYNKNQVEPDQIHVRIGLNHGLGMIKDKDVFGDVVNVAARIESLAKTEQVFISESLWEKVREAKIPCEKIPEVSVKGKAEKLTIYEVQWRKVQPSATVQLPAQAPAVAARVPVAKAAEPTSEQKGTVMMQASPVAVLTKPKLQYSLVVVRPDGTHGQAVKLENVVSVLGRVEGDILFPDDPLVSRRHAKFTVQDAGVTVEDLRSANGIFWRLRFPHTLQNADIILMGRQMFRFAFKPPEGPPGQSPSKGGKFKLPKPGEEKGAPAGPSGAELIRLLPGGVEDKHYSLATGENILGRTRGTLTFPEDAYLSSQHARVKAEDGKCLLEDLQSGNGTFVGVRDKTTLTDGDILLIGHQLLRITATPS